MAVDRSTLEFQKIDPHHTHSHLAQGFVFGEIDFDRIDRRPVMILAVPVLVAPDQSSIAGTRFEYAAKALVLELGPGSFCQCLRCGIELIWRLLMVRYRVASNH